MMTYLQGASKPMAMWPESLGVPKDNTKGSEILYYVIPLCIIFPGAWHWHKSQRSKDCAKVRDACITVFGWNKGISYKALTWGS